jgi:hypothetical protein
MFATRLTLLVALLCAAISEAAPPLTPIRDILYKADGTRFEGMAQVEWKTFRASDGSEVPQNGIQVRVQNGVVNLDLVPTTNAQKPAYYTVRFTTGGRTQFVEYWSVPPTSSPVRLQDVRTHAPTAGELTETPVTVTIQDVSGLRTELDLRPQRGVSWMPGRSAVIGASGGIEGAIGDPGSCVRVDGTSTPCGFGGITYVDSEIPLGNVNGVNTMFTLSAPPTPASSLAVFRNGMLQTPGVYSLQGQTVTFAPGYVPETGDQVLVSYRVTADSGLVYVDLETPQGLVNGANAQYTLSSVPMPAASLHLYRNGLLQKAGLDYTLSVNTIIFVSAAIPGPGDVLLATYRK